MTLADEDAPTVGVGMDHCGGLRVVACTSQAVGARLAWRRRSTGLRRRRSGRPPCLAVAGCGSGRRRSRGRAPRARHLPRPTRDPLSRVMARNRRCACPEERTRRPCGCGAVLLPPATPTQAPARRDERSCARDMQPVAEGHRSGSKTLTSLPAAVTTQTPSWTDGEPAGPELAACETCELDDLPRLGVDAGHGRLELARHPDQAVPDRHGARERIDVRGSARPDSFPDRSAAAARRRGRAPRSRRARVRAVSRHRPDGFSRRPRSSRDRRGRSLRGRSRPRRPRTTSRRRWECRRPESSARRRAAQPSRHGRVMPACGGPVSVQPTPAVAAAATATIADRRSITAHLSLFRSFNLPVRVDCRAGR